MIGQILRFQWKLGKVFCASCDEMQSTNLQQFIYLISSHSIFTVPNCHYAFLAFFRCFFVECSRESPSLLFVCHLLLLKIIRNGESFFLCVIFTFVAILSGSDSGNIFKGIQANRKSHEKLNSTRWLFLVSALRFCSVKWIYGQY